MQAQMFMAKSQAAPPAPPAPQQPEQGVTEPVKRTLKKVESND